MSGFVCNLCGVSKSNLGLLNTHIRHIHTKDYNYVKCYFCFRSIQGSKLESHIGWHTKELPYRCHFGCTAYNWKSSLLQHYRKYHSGFKLNLRPISLQCYFCGRNNKTPLFLDNHLRAAHTFEKPFKCDFTKCVRTFPTSGYKNIHVNYFCTKNPQKRQLYLNKISCYFCHVKLSCRSLSFHMNGHTEEKPYKCMHCNLRFAQPSVQKRHVIRKHKIHLLHKCSFCGLSKVTVGELNTHIRQIHVKESKLFKCYFCEKEFSQIVPKGHMVIHTKEIHYKCKYCPAQYTTNKTLKYHYFKSHPELVDADKIKSQFTFSCEICGEKFFTQELLLAHVRKHQRGKICLKTEEISRTKRRSVDVRALINRIYRNCNNKHPIG